MTSRRTLLGVIAVAPAVALLARCSDPASITPAQVVSDLQTVTAALSAALTAAVAADPTAIPAATVRTVQGDLSQASTVASSLSASLAATTGASTAQTIVADINDGISILADPPINGLIPAPFSTAIAAFDLILPSIESFVGSVIPSTTGAASGVVTKAALVRMKARAMAPGLTTADQARAAIAALAAKH